jgi:hypothetical protein
VKVSTLGHERPHDPLAEEARQQHGEERAHGVAHHVERETAPEAEHEAAQHSGELAGYGRHHHLQKLHGQKHPGGHRPEGVEPGLERLPAGLEILARKLGHEVDKGLGQVGSGQPGHKRQRQRHGHRARQNRQHGGQTRHLALQPLHHHAPRTPRHTLRNTLNLNRY